jgi:hypothetical protein
MLLTPVPVGSIALAFFLVIFGVACMVMAWLHVTQAILGKAQAVSVLGPPSVIGLEFRSLIECDLGVRKNNNYSTDGQMLGLQSRPIGLLEWPPLYSC